MILMIDTCSHLNNYQLAYSFAESLRSMCDKAIIDRIVVEAYDEHCVCAIHAVGGINIQYYIHPFTERKDGLKDIDDIIRFCNHYGVYVVSYPWVRARKSTVEVKKLSESGFIIFSNSRFNLNIKKKKLVGCNP